MPRVHAAYRGIMTVPTPNAEQILRRPRLFSFLKATWDFTFRLRREKRLALISDRRSNCPGVAEATGAITSSFFRGTSPKPRSRPALLSRRHLEAIRQRPQHQRDGRQQLVALRHRPDRPCPDTCS